MNDENLVRQALRLQASRAPDPELIRAALPARAVRFQRARRVRGLGIGVSSLAVLAVLAVPVLTLRASNGQSALGAGADSSDAIGSVPLRFSPTWMPSGFVERARTVGGSPQDPALQRSWRDVGQGCDFYTGRPEITLQISESTQKALPINPPMGGEQVQVNGRAGVYETTEGPNNPTPSFFLTWWVGPTTVGKLTAWNRVTAREEMLRIASSLVPDQGSQRLPMKVGWVPEGMRPATAGVCGTSVSNWETTMRFLRNGSSPVLGLSAGPSDVARRPQVSITLGTKTSAPSGGEAVTVAGRKARYVASPEKGGGYLVISNVVPTHPDFKLTVFTTGSRAELFRVAENVTVLPISNVAWLGR